MRNRIQQCCSSASQGGHTLQGWGRRPSNADTGNFHLPAGQLIRPCASTFTASQGGHTLQGWGRRPNTLNKTRGI